MTESKKTNIPDTPSFLHRKKMNSVVLNFLISALVTSFGFVIFIQAIPYFEKQVFPSCYLIETLKQNVETLSQKMEEIQKSIVLFEQKSEKVSALQAQVTGVQEALGQILKSMAGLEEKINSQQQLNKTPVAAPSVSNTALKEKWLTIQNRVERGEAFSDTLHELIPLFSEDRPLLDVLHQLTVYADGRVKTLDHLINNLTDIYNLIKKGKTTEMVSEPGKEKESGFWGLLVERLKGVVRITKEEDLAALEKNKEGQKQALITLDKSIKELQKLNLETALVYIKPLAHEHSALLEPWVLDAEKRLAFNNLFNTFKIKFESFLVRVS